MLLTRGTAIALALTIAALPGEAQQPFEPLSSTPPRIAFWVGESYADRAGRTRILLQASTEKSYACASLAGRRTSRGDTITIDQWHVTGSRRFCEDESAPAAGEIPLGVDTGSYTLAIRHLGEEDRYRVVITGDAIHVAPLAHPSVSILRDTLAWRFPRNSFAVGCGTTEMNAWMCAEFYRMLADKPYLTTIDIPAVGVNPYRAWVGSGGSWHNDGLRYFRIDPSSVPRFRRDVQAFYDAYVGRRLGYGISITPWTGMPWYATPPEQGEIR